MVHDLRLPLTAADTSQGSVSSGILRWKLTVVRPCDMFWMGVTSRFSLDMSTMIANDRQVWMVSEEGTCFEHCRGTAPVRRSPPSQGTSGAPVSSMAHLGWKCDRGCAATRACSAGVTEEAM